MRNRGAINQAEVPVASAKLTEVAGAARNRGAISQAEMPVASAKPTEVVSAAMKQAA